MKPSPTVTGLIRYMLHCERRMEATHGGQINIRWLHWLGEWGETWEAMKKLPRSPRRNSLLRFIDEHGNLSGNAKNRPRAAEGEAHGQG